MWQNFGAGSTELVTSLGNSLIVKEPYLVHPLCTHYPCAVQCARTVHPLYTHAHALCMQCAYDMHVCASLQCAHTVPSLCIQ